MAGANRNRAPPFPCLMNGMKCVGRETLLGTETREFVLTRCTVALVVNCENGWDGSRCSRPAQSRARRPVRTICDNCITQQITDDIYELQSTFHVNSTLAGGTESPLTDEEKSERRAYIAQFNCAMGSASPVKIAMQCEFMSGEMSFDDAVSFLRYCEYMLHGARQHAGQ